MTTYQFLKFIAEVRGFRGNEKEQRIRDVIQKIELQEVVNRPIENLSKGFKRIEHDRATTDHKNKTHHDGENKRNNLIFRQCRHAHTYSEKRAGHQPTAQISGNDNTVVRLAEVIHRQP